MADLLTLDQLKKHLKLDLADTSEDELLGAYLAAATAMFKVASKRTFPPDTAPDPDALINPSVLSTDEVEIAKQWLRFMVAHLYENKQAVIADVRAVVVELPLAAQYLMKLVREPTL
jgi:hypothetical protein